MESLDHIAEFPVGIFRCAVRALWRKIKSISIAPVVYFILLALCGNQPLRLLLPADFHKFIGRHQLYGVNSKFLPVWDHLDQAFKGSPKLRRKLGLLGITPDVNLVKDHVPEIRFR